jgi:hypothetical protein
VLTSPPYFRLRLAQCASCRLLRRFVLTWHLEPFPRRLPHPFRAFSAEPSSPPPLRGHWEGGVIVPGGYDIPARSVSGPTYHSTRRRWCEPWSWMLEN